MKKLFTIAILSLCLGVFAQVPSYNVNPVLLGTNSIGASTNLTLPLLLSSTIITNYPSIMMPATNAGLVLSNYFSLPTNYWMSITNTFISSNTVSGTATNSFFASFSVTNTSTIPYYKTNGAYVTYSNGLPILTNSAVIMTNYQSFIYSVSVPFKAIGTNYSTTTTNNVYGAEYVDVTKAKNANIFISFNLAGSGTSPLTLVYYPSQRSTNGYQDTISQKLAVTANGTSTVATNYLLSVGEYGYLSLAYVTNANASALTNLIIQVSQKVQSP